MLKNVSRVLLLRGDKIGDVTLITPAITALRVAQPGVILSAMVRKSVADVLIGNPALDNVIPVDPERHSGLTGFFRLVREIRQGRFEVLVVFQGSFRLVFAAFLARIPYRIGPLSKWWSFFLLNMGMRQSRSNVEMHEADYNLQLLRDLGVKVNEARHTPLVFVQNPWAESAAKFFQERGVRDAFPTVAIHPGMAGSALNWPESHYVRLGRRLLRNYNLIITGGPGEDELVERVLQKIAQHHRYDRDLPVLTKYCGGKDLGEFIAILDRCDGVVAPSTGPMHIAVALGKKVVTVFSPIRVQSALRWGPYGVRCGTPLGISPNDKASVLVPDVNCAEGFKCALQACIYYPCMPRISVDDVETQLRVLIEGGSISMVKNPSQMDDIDDTDLETEDPEELPT